MPASHLHRPWLVATLGLHIIFLIGLPPFATSSPSPSISNLSNHGPHTFAAGEELAYAVYYMGFEGGTVAMDTRNGGTQDGRQVYKLLNRARSQQPVTAFFPVDDRIESLIDAESFAPLELVFHKHEGRTRTESAVTFHHDEGTATTTKDGVAETRSIPPGTQHAFSAALLPTRLTVRTVGSEMTLNVHHEKKNSPLHAKVEGVEEIAGAWGTRKALRAGVTLPYTGIWLNSGKMGRWVTDDPSHVPLKVQAKIVIGSITAELVDGPAITHEFDDPNARTSL